jgi:hypothetical protein
MNIIVETLQTLMSHPHKKKSLDACDELPWGGVILT